MSDLEDAVRKEVMRCRTSGIRFNAHRVVNNFAAQGIKVTVSNVRKLRTKIELELGPVQPIYRERARPTTARPVVAPGHESVMAPTDDRPVITPSVMIDYASGTVAKAPYEVVVLDTNDYDQLCDAFMDDDDYEEGRRIDLAYVLEDEEQTKDGKPVLCLGYEYGRDAQFPIDRADLVIQLTALLADRARERGEMSPYDPELPMEPLEIWYDIGPGEMDPVIGWCYWPNIKLLQEDPHE